MSYRTCQSCGATRAPWSLGHDPTCPEYQPTRSTRLCGSCGRPAGVLRIEHEPRIVVEFGCRHGCDETWQETTEPDDEQPQDLDDDDDLDLDEETSDD